MKAPTLDEIKLISVLIESVLYGCYVISFVLTCWVLTKRRNGAHIINKSMIAISSVMFFIATLHLLVSHIRVYAAFIVWRNAPQGGPAWYFRQIYFLTEVMATSLYMCQTLIGDGLALWRAYKVWGNRLAVVIVPSILLIGSMIVDLHVILTFSESTKNLVPPSLTRWFYAFPALTFATNLSCTALIAYRIWYIQKKVSRGFSPALLIIIESGAIYSFTLIYLLVGYGIGSLFSNIALDSISSIAGLVSSMVFVRIGLGVTTPSGEYRMSISGFVADMPRPSESSVDPPQMRTLPGPAE